MSIKARIFRNAGALAWCKVSGTLCRLVQVPLLLSGLGVEDFGRWLVISTFPSWLMLANMGFGSVAANEVSMAVAVGEENKANKIFSTTLLLVLGIAVLGIIATVMCAPLIPWWHFLHAPAVRQDEMVKTITWLGIAIFIYFSMEALNSRFRAAQKPHIPVFIFSLRQWMDVLGIFISLKFSKRLDHLALAILISTTVHLLLYMYFSWRSMPSLRLSLKFIDLGKCAYLFKKGAAFQAFPLGNALLFEGNLLIVQTVIGPAGVAIFGTVRTLVRTVSQAMELINQAVWPEISHLFGAKQFKQAAKLHQSAVSLSIIISTAGVIFLAIAGQAVYGYWVGKSIVLPQSLLLTFLLPIPFNALWLTSSVVHMASNQHEGLAIRYMIAAFVSALACALFSSLQGLQGAALSTLLFDIVLIPYVLKRSIELTEDTWKDFAAGLVKGPWLTLMPLVKSLKAFR